MNIGLIGFGYWGKNLYRNLLISDQIKKIYIFEYVFLVHNESIIFEIIL